jgi:tetratricopeptide (TPR) repeat protein
VARRPFHGRAIFEYRAVALHRLGHFARAAADYAQALHYQPDWTHLLWCRAVMLVLAGDAEAHQHLCRAALDRYENGGSAGALFDIARTCSLAPLPLIEARRALKLAERAVADSPNTSWYQRTLATCHLRAGQPEEAIRLHTASAEGSTLSRTLRWLPLALAHHQIGEGDQARAWHEKAAALIDAAVRDMPKEASGPADVHPNDWLEIQALYREAATLLAAGPPKRAP